MMIQTKWPFLILKSTWFKIHMVAKWREPVVGTEPLSTVQYLDCKTSAPTHYQEGRSEISRIECQAQGSPKRSKSKE